MLENEEHAPTCKGEETSDEPSLQHEHALHDILVELLELREIVLLA